MECGGRHLAPGLRIKTENKGFAGSRAQTAPARKKPPPFVSKWGRAATAYTHHSILWCPGNLWPRRMCFFMGVLSDDLFEAAGYQICQDHFHRVARKERNDARHQRGLDVASGLENKPCTS